MKFTKILMTKKSVAHLGSYSCTVFLPRLMQNFHKTLSLRFLRKSKTARLPNFSPTPAPVNGDNYATMNLPVAPRWIIGCQYRNQNTNSKLHTRGEVHIYGDYTRRILDAWKNIWPWADINKEIEKVVQGFSVLTFYVLEEVNLRWMVK